MIQSTAIVLLVLVAIPFSGSAQSCVGNPAAVQVLGTGGPRTNRDRASAGYLVWGGTEAKILVDMSGGDFFRFGQDEAKFGNLSLVAASYLHPDHLSDPLA